MIVEIRMRVEADDDLDVVDVGEVISRRLRPLPTRIVALVEKFELVPPGGPRGRPPLQRTAAKTWLKGYLAGGAKYVTDVREAGLEAGLAWKTLRKASRDMNIVVTPRGGGRNCKWRLP